MTLPSKIPRRIKIGLIVLGIGFVITFGFFVDVVGRIQSLMNEKEAEENPFTKTEAPLFTQADPAVPVKLFFPGSQGGPKILVAEDRTIFRSAELINRAKQILQQLLEGPKSPGLFPSIPPETKLHEIFVDDEGTAFVDFSIPISANHPGGMTNEQATVYSIVNSLTYNLPEIRQVKILVGGAEKETLAGHCLLIPLEMDLSIAGIAPEEPTPDAN